MSDPHKERIDNFLKIYRDRYAGPSDTPTGLTSFLKWLGGIYEGTPNKEYLEEGVRTIHRDHQLVEFDDKFAMAVFKGEYGMTEKEQEEMLRAQRKAASTPKIQPYNPVTQGLGQDGWNSYPNIQTELEQVMKKHQQDRQQQPKGLFGLGWGSK